jgi:hypothetical protein
MRALVVGKVQACSLYLVACFHDFAVSCEEFASRYEAPDMSTRGGSRTKYVSTRHAVEVSS